MKKNILCLLIAGAFIILNAKAPGTETANTHSASNIDSLLEGCWKIPATDTILYIPYIVDSGPHQHYFYIENYVDVTQACTTHFSNAFRRGIGSTNGQQFSVTLFGVDTAVYNGLIDTVTLKMEVYSTTDTTVYIKF